MACNQIGAGALFKKKKKVCIITRRAERGRAAEYQVEKLLLSITHTPLSPVFTPPSAADSPLTGSTLVLCHSASLTIALFGLSEEYETAWRGISAPSPREKKICQFISQPAIWQARLLLLKDIIQARGRHRRHRSPLPLPLLSLLSPPPSLPSFIPLFPFHLPPCLLQSVELRLLRLKRALGPRQGEKKRSWKEQGREKKHTPPSITLLHEVKKK